MAFVFRSDHSQTLSDHHFYFESASSCNLASILPKVKILFAIQGTGNGHLSRARDVYPELCRHGKVDVLVSGSQVDVEVPFPIKYRMYGMSFIFGKKGGVNLVASVRKLCLWQLWRDIRTLDVKQYDLVVNDFEEISAWAAWLRKVPCIALSHQWAVKHKAAPKAKHPDWRGIFLLRWYAPCKQGYGFHFEAYAKDLFTPVIRREVRKQKVTNEGHIAVYLPAYDEAVLLPFLQSFDEVKWEVFSKHTKEERIEDNVHVQPVNNLAFIERMASSNGVLMGAGFEGPAEALFLGKKLMVIPMQDQYEQQCNAAAMARLGVPIMKRLNSKYRELMQDWLDGKFAKVEVSFPNQTAEIVDELMRDFLKD